MILHLLVIDGSQTLKLTEALSAMAYLRVDGFRATELCEQEESYSTRVNGLTWRTLSDVGDPVLFRLRKLKPKLYAHSIWDDPHGMYLDACDTTEIQKDGTSEYLKVRMGPDIQDFSTTLELGRSVSCLKFRPCLLRDQLTSRSQLLH